MTRTSLTYGKNPIFHHDSQLKENVFTKIFLICQFYYSRFTRTWRGVIKLTTMSFPAFSGLFAILIAAAAAAPEDIPTWDSWFHNQKSNKKPNKNKRSAMKVIYTLIRNRFNEIAQNSIELIIVSFKKGENLQIDLLSVQWASQFQLLHHLISGNITHKSDVTNEKQFWLPKVIKKVVIRVKNKRGKLVDNRYNTTIKFNNRERDSH